ncbi:MULTISPECIES: acyl carrier protein [unclassified Shewanella]|uniref:acyl carrier protein n=1 Tax=unclassified Shewanella TaxID=196818 RepID=UPI0021D8CDA8|nr:MULTISPECIES: acyl carrier protein [unclassified Shewanella]MCU8044153.1 acyl carrier protein [Shewanella sp. SM68]MCU8048235.1 acyl carrier protein [Shewanella sp. SM65]
MLRKIILEKFNEALAQTSVTKSYAELSDDTVLLETELDSLGFAILVALLEEELDYDPFQLMENAVYPQTFGDFVAIYEKYSK